MGSFHYVFDLVLGYDCFVAICCKITKKNKKSHRSEVGFLVFLCLSQLSHYNFLRFHILAVDEAQHIDACGDSRCCYAAATL